MLADHSPTARVQQATIVDRRPRSALLATRARRRREAISGHRYGRPTVHELRRAATADHDPHTW